MEIMVLHTVAIRQVGPLLIVEEEVVIEAIAFEDAF